MSSAALHGKVDRNEDALTACFVDLLRIHEDRSLVGALLGASAVMDATGRATAGRADDWLSGVNWDTFVVELWPRWQSGEPDAVLDLLCGGRVVTRVVIEAKAGAGKSGEECDLVPEGALPPSGDQLAAYLCDAVATSATGVRVGLIYLTHHAAAPREDLAQSIAACSRRGVAAPIAWCGWRDVEDALVERARSSGPYGRAAGDAVALLRLYGYARFRGRWRHAATSTLPTIRPGLIWHSPRAPGTAPRFPGARSWSVARSLGAPPPVLLWGHQVPPRRSFRLGVDRMRQLPAVIFHRAGVSSC